MHKNSRVKSDNDLISVSLVLRAFHPLTADESSARIRNEELGMKVAASPRSFGSGRSCSGIRYLTYDVSRRSG